MISWSVVHGFRLPFVRRLSAGILVLSVCCGSHAVLADPLISLSVDANQPVANDLAFATVSAEASGPALKVQSKKVNEQLTEALALIRSTPGIKAKTGNTMSYPVYGQNSRIENWRVSSSIELQASDMAVLSDLIGKLQDAGLAVTNTRMEATPETRGKALDAATLEAIALFQARARTIAGALSKPYKIKELNISSRGERPVYPQMEVRGKFASVSSSMPIESGESMVTVTVSGRIELSD